jgi:hypothetical protein
MITKTVDMATTVITNMEIVAMVMAVVGDIEETGDSFQH